MPRPTTNVDLADRVDVGIREVFGDGLGSLRVVATVDGPDVPTLEVDLTGLVVGGRGAASAPPSGAPSAEVVHRETGTIGTASLRAWPVMVAEVPVGVDAVLHGLRFSWLEGADGSLAVKLQDPSDQHPVSGQGRAAVHQERLVAALRRQVSESLAASGFTLSSLDVHLVSHGPTALGVQADARVRKGMLSAAVRVGAVAEVSADLVVTVRDVEVTSRNPLVAGLLLAFRGKLEAVQRERFDLAAELPAGVRITDLRLDVSDELVLTARLG